MYDEASASQEPQKGKKQRTPDLLDVDPFLESLKSLQAAAHRMAYNVPPAMEEEDEDDDEIIIVDDDDDDVPGCSTASQPPPPPSAASASRRGGGGGGQHKKEADEPVTFPRRKHLFDPGRFLWIWLMGLRLPSLVIDGEPHLPVEILTEVLSRKNKDDAKYFRELLSNQNVYTRTCTDQQYEAIFEKSEVCRELNIPTLILMSRSDIERVMGEMRGESSRTKTETDEWNPNERVRIVHVNFIDYNDQWLMSDDLDEDPNEAGTHGFWYKSRKNMRCIECAQCQAKFTPPDFIMHHHFPLPTYDITHVGCASNQWQHLIELHKSAATDENRVEWRTFLSNSRRFTQRAYDDAAPVEEVVEPMETEPPEDFMEIDKEAAIDAEGETIQPEKRRWTLDPNDDESCCKKRKLELADFIGHSSEEGVFPIPRDSVEAAILKELKKMDKKALEMLFLKSPEEFYTWLKEMDFEKNVIAQHKEWDAKRNDPNYRHIGTANFSPSKRRFENTNGLEVAPLGVRFEIQALSERLSKIHDATANEPWKALGLEKLAVQHVSPAAIEVLSCPPKLPPKSLLQAHMEQLKMFAQLLLNGGKEMIPILQQFNTIRNNLQLAQFQQQQQQQKSLPMPMFPVLPAQLASLPPTPIVGVSPIVSTPILPSPTVVTPITPATVPLAFPPAGSEHLNQLIAQILAQSAAPRLPKLPPPPPPPPLPPPIANFNGLFQLERFAKILNETTAVQN